MEFPVPGLTNDSGAIMIGADGNLWFNEYNGNRIGRMTLAGVVTEFPVPTASAGIGGCALASDQHLWCTEINASQLARVATDGTITELPALASSRPSLIIIGPDGGLWIAEFYAGIDSGRIASVTLAGQVTELTPRNLSTSNLTSGPDGSIWFVENSGNYLGRISLGGTVDRFMPPTTASGPLGIVTGPDGNLWFTEVSAGKIGRYTP